MHVDKVDVAASAVADEVVEVVGAHVVGAGRATVGDSWRTKQRFASKGFHVLLPGCDGAVETHAG